MTETTNVRGRWLSIIIALSWVGMAGYLWFTGDKIGTDSLPKLIRWWAPMVPIFCLVFQLSRWRRETK